MSSLEWLKQANCKGYPVKWWFPERGDDGEKVKNFKAAKQICFVCPVKNECYQYGIENASYGVWGGISLGGRDGRRVNESDKRRMGLSKV